MDYIQKIKLLYNLMENRNYGYSENEIIKVENTLGIKFPKVLRDYYLLLGKNKKINETFNRLLKIKNDEIGFTDDNEYLVFYEENQCVVYWAIKKDELKDNNPKVYGNYDPKNSFKDWFTDSKTMDGFLLSMAYWNGVLGGLKYNANYSDDNGIENEIITSIEENWEEIKGITNQNLRFFSNDNIEILALTTDVKNNANGIFIGTENKKCFNKIIKTINIKWDYRSDEDE